MTALAKSIALLKNCTAASAIAATAQVRFVRLFPFRCDCPERPVYGYSKQPSNFASIDIGSAKVVGNRMIKFRDIADDDPVLDHSRMYFSRLAGLDF